MKPRGNRIFISYRREGGADLARVVRAELEKRGYDTFLDVEDLNEAGPFPDKLKTEISAAENVVVILSAGCLDRCIAATGDPSEDWFRQESALAMRLGKRVVPVIARDFQWPSAPLPEDIQELLHCQALTPSHDYFDASMDRLESLLAGRRPRRRVLSVLIGLILLTITMAALLRSGAFVGARRGADEYVAVTFPDRPMGTLLSEENYGLELEIKNLTSMPMEITRIVLEQHNAKAAELLGLSGSRVYTSEYRVPVHLEPHEETTIDVRGNQILTDSVVVSVFHSLSGKASQFQVDLDSILLDMPEPRVLPESVIEKGMDALVALKALEPEARKWRSDAHLEALFPGNSEVIIEPTTRLKCVVAKSWIATYYSAGRGEYFTAHFDGRSVDSKSYAEEEHTEAATFVPRADPVISDQDAVAFVNSQRWICGSWTGPRLGKARVGGRWSYVWFLAYRGPDSLPLIVDAITGALLVPSEKDKGFREASVRPTRRR